MADSDYPTSSASQFYLGNVNERLKKMFIQLGKWENSFYQNELSHTAIKNPVFICGLARSGTTILLEALNQCFSSVFACHQYQDFPFIHNTILWSRFLHNAQLFSKPEKAKEQAKERAHQDGIKITPESPEAMEEMLWCDYFDFLHDPNQSNILGEEVSNKDFEAAYKTHIKKILKVRGGRARYLAKNNYNISRLTYLKKLFPDAIFLIPYRKPETHIASLVSQQKLFENYAQQDPRSLRYMQQAKHYEFGADRRAINFGDKNSIEKISSLWASNSEDEHYKGWALYWQSCYEYLHTSLSESNMLNKQAHLVCYESLCTDTEAVNQILDHCGLSYSAETSKAISSMFRLSEKSLEPQYKAVIEENTQETYNKLLTLTASESHPADP